jgi:hypothetical protein
MAFADALPLAGGRRVFAKAQHRVDFVGGVLIEERFATYRSTRWTEVDRLGVGEASISPSPIGPKVSIPPAAAEQRRRGCDQRAVKKVADDPRSSSWRDLRNTTIWARCPTS